MQLTFSQDMQDGSRCAESLHWNHVNNVLSFDAKACMAAFASGVALASTANHCKRRFYSREKEP